MADNPFEPPAEAPPPLPSSSSPMILMGLGTVSLFIAFLVGVPVVRDSMCLASVICFVAAWRAMPREE